MISAVGVNTSAVNILHDQIGATVISGAAIEECGNVGMLQASENLSLGLKATGNDLGPEANPNDFDGDLLFVLAIGALSQKYGAHAAVSEFLQYTVGANALKSRSCLKRHRSRTVQKRFGFLVRGQE